MEHQDLPVAVGDPLKRLDDGDMVRVYRLCGDRRGQPQAGPCDHDEVAPPAGCHVPSDLAHPGDRILKPADRGPSLPGAQERLLYDVFRLRRIPEVGISCAASAPYRTRYSVSKSSSDGTRPPSHRTPVRGQPASVSLTKDTRQMPGRLQRPAARCGSVRSGGTCGYRSAPAYGLRPTPQVACSAPGPGL
jgi:hypothetical protein